VRLTVPRAETVVVRTSRIPSTNNSDLAGAC